MTRKKLQGLGWLSAIFCLVACNTADKTAEGHVASNIGNPVAVAAKDTVTTLAATQPAPPAGTGYGSGTDAFLGTWTTRAESRVSNCGSDTSVSDLFGTSITWSAGAAGHIQAPLVGKCVLDARVSGKGATAADQTCYDNGLTYTVGGTFTIQPDGTAQFAEHARVTGRGVNCTGSLTGPFVKGVQ